MLSLKVISLGNLVDKFFFCFAGANKEKKKATKRKPSKGLHNFSFYMSK